MATGAAEERLNLRFDVLPITSPALPLGPLTAQANARHELNLAALLVCLIVEERGMTAPTEVAFHPAVAEPDAALLDLLRLSMERGERLASDAAELGAIALPWPLPELPYRSGPVGESWAYDDGFMKDFHPASAMDTNWQVV